MTALLAGLVAAIFLTPAVIVSVRRWALIDVPNHRSSHELPTPRGGGIAVLAASMIGVAASTAWTDQLVALVVGAVILGAVGLADDVMDLPASVRLVAQLAVPAILVIAIGGQSTAALIGSALVAAVVAAGYVNAFNFMDGVNGISATQAIIAGVHLAALGAAMDRDEIVAGGLALAGAAAGFLPFNAIRARVFLGDVGSYFMGFWLVGLAVIAFDAGAKILVIVAPFLLYLLDTITVLIRRWRRGERLTQAHREHAYQRLVAAGWSHPAVSGLCAAVSAVCAVLMAILRDASDLTLVVGFLGCCALVVVYLSLPNVLERSHQALRGAT